MVSDVEKIEGFLSKILELWSAWIDLFISHHLRNNRFLAPANLLIDLKSVLRKHLLIIIQMLTLWKLANKGIFEVVCKPFKVSLSKWWKVKLALVIYDFEVEVQSFISGFNPSEKVLKMLINTIENHRVVTWWWVERDSNVWLMMLLGKKYTRSTASTLSSLTDRGRCLKIWGTKNSSEFENLGNWKCLHPWQ